MKVFIDTWAWYALSDTTDRDHDSARLANEELLEGDNTFVTTNFVVSEATTLLRYHLSHQAAVRFRRMLQQLIESELVELVRVSEEQEQEAGRIFERYSDQDFSFVDCLSFAVMRAEDIQTVFTGDNHFATMGFLLRP